MKPVLNIKITILSRQLMNKCILMFFYPEIFTIHKIKQP